jgi:UDP-glucose 4-epimerase
MKKILVTAKNSFIGNSFERYIKTTGDCEVHKISLREPGWEDSNWREYDAVLHVAGIAQMDTGPISEEKRGEYGRVNAEMTRKVAEKAKQDSVRHLIYISTIMVYGNPSGLDTHGILDSTRIPKPASVYGTSKLEGEKILEFQTDDFTVSVVRTPMVYGREKSGELQSWNRLSRYCFFFPRIDNYRGMIYIDNLCEWIRQLIRFGKGGISFPQDERVLSTSELIYELRRLQGKRTILLPGFLWLVKVCCKCSQKFNLLLGNLGYAPEMTENLSIEYRKVTTEEALRRTFTNV